MLKAENRDAHPAFSCHWGGGFHSASHLLIMVHLQGNAGEDLSVRGLLVRPQLLFRTVEK